MCFTPCQLLQRFSRSGLHLGRCLHTLSHTVCHIFGRLRLRVTFGPETLPRAMSMWVALLRTSHLTCYLAPALSNSTGIERQTLDLSSSSLDFRLLRSRRTQAIACHSKTLASHSPAGIHQCGMKSRLAQPQQLWTTVKCKVQCPTLLNARNVHNVHNLHPPPWFSSCVACAWLKPIRTYQISKQLVARIGKLCVDLCGRLGICRAPPCLSAHFAEPSEFKTREAECCNATHASCEGKSQRTGPLDLNKA